MNRKKRSLIALSAGALLMATSLRAQEEYNKWSIEPYFGVNAPFAPFKTGYSTGAVNLFGTGLNTRYMFNHNAGLSLDLGLNQFSSDRTNFEFTTFQTRFIVNGVINLGQLLEFNQWSNRFGLLGRVGAGVSILSPDKVALGKGNDKTISAVLGVTPQIRLSDRVALQVDLSFQGNMMQTRTFDYKGGKSNGGFDSYQAHLTAGLAIYLGKKKQHADWHIPVDPLKQRVDSLQAVLAKTNELVNSLDARVVSLEEKSAQMEKDLQDDDNDGVANKFDEEPNSTPNVRVDTKGREIKDLVPDSGQSLDRERGLFFTVQLGVYSKEVPNDVFKNVGPLETKTMPDMTIRYFSGKFHSQEEAELKLKDAKKAGISDAFMTAYYKGERITLAEARTLLQEKGPSILAPKN